MRRFEFDWLLSCLSLSFQSVQIRCASARHVYFAITIMSSQQRTHTAIDGEKKKEWNKFNALFMLFRWRWRWRMGKMCVRCAGIWLKYSIYENINRWTEGLLRAMYPTHTTWFILKLIHLSFYILLNVDNKAISIRCARFHSIYTRFCLFSLFFVLCLLSFIKTIRGAIVFAETITFYPCVRLITWPPIFLETRTEFCSTYFDAKKEKNNIVAGSAL